MIKRFVTIFAVAVVLVVAFPPWNETTVDRPGRTITRPLGFRPIWNPPPTTAWAWSVQLNTNQLWIEILGAAAVSVLIAKIPPTLIVGWMSRVRKRKPTVKSQRPTPLKDPVQPLVKAASQQNQPAGRNGLLRKLLLSAIVFAIGAVVFSIAKEEIVSAGHYRAMEASPDTRALARSLRAHDAWSRWHAIQKLTRSSARQYDMVRKGRLRLPTEDQARLIGILAEERAKLGAHDCAALAKGSVSQGAANILLTMDSASLATFSDLSARAFVAEVNQSPVATVATDDDVVQFIQLILGTLNQVDVIRFASIVESFSTASDHDVCWFDRTMEGVALRAQGVDRTTALRVVTSFQARLNTPMSGLQGLSIDSYRTTGRTSAGRYFPELDDPGSLETNRQEAMEREYQAWKAKKSREDSISREAMEREYQAWKAKRAIDTLRQIR